MRVMRRRLLTTLLGARPSRKGKNYEKRHHIYGGVFVYTMLEYI